MMRKALEVFFQKMAAAFTEAFTELEVARAATVAANADAIAELRARLTTAEQDIADLKAKVEGTT